ncbi:MAG: TIGR02186 family protein [Pseudomonadota bacterium]
MTWGMRLLAGLLGLVVLAAPLRADDQVVASLSQTSVSLDTQFTGSELFIYGAIKPDPGHEDDKFDVIVEVIGPLKPVDVRKKQRNLGIWYNGPAVEIDKAPSFFALATSGEFRDIISYTDDLLFEIGLEHFIQLIDAPEWVEDRDEYIEALGRIREAEGLYAELPGAVEIKEKILLETRIKLPANLTEGDYTARIFVLRDKKVQDVYTQTIEVRRAGLGRFIYSAAQDYPAIYGIVSILVALIAGWLASAFFRTFFPT